MTLGGEFLDQRDRAALAVFLGLEGRVGTRVLEHRERVQRDVRAAPGVGGRGKVVGIRLAGHLEHGDRDAGRHFGAGGEPFGLGPALHDSQGEGVARLCLGRDVVEVVEHQERLLEPFGRHRGEGRVVEQIDERLDVVAADHRAEQLGGTGLVDQGA